MNSPCYEPAGLLIQLSSLTRSFILRTTFTATQSKVTEKGLFWAPEFLKFPMWAVGADLMFAEAAARSRPILFRGGVGGPCVSRTGCARRRETRNQTAGLGAHWSPHHQSHRDVGKQAAFGEFGRESDLFMS